MWLISLARGFWQPGAMQVLFQKASEMKLLSERGAQAYEGEEAEDVR